MISASKQPSRGLFGGEADIGNPQRAGSCAVDVERQVYSIEGAGANIWGVRDEFHFVWKRMTGDFIATMRAEFIGAGANPHRKLGWMARKSLADNSPHVSTAIHGDGLLSLQFRRTEGGDTEEEQAALRGADIIQLERKGDVYTMSVAPYGQPFTAVEVDAVELGDEIYLGLFVCSHEENVLEAATFSNVRIVVPAQEHFNRGKDPFASHLEIVDVSNGDRRILYSADRVFEAPNWEPSGKTLIYNEDGQLYRFDLATKTPSLIDTGDVRGNNNDHVLSFDGKMLAISSSSAEERTSIVYTVPVEGGQPKRITPTGPSYLHGWSPDGKFLVYTGQRDGQFDIYRIPVDGGQEVPLTHTVGLDDGPEYTPDGEYIYFNSVRSGRMQIWRMQADGSQQEQLTDDEYNNWFPHISPDGQSIAFVSYLVGEVEPSDHPAAKRIYLRLMPRDGGRPQVLAYLYGGQGTMNVPSWSPDSKELAFVSNTVPHA